METVPADRYRPGWSILLSLILLPPVGIVVMWKYADWPDWLKSLCTLVFGWVALMEGVFIIGFTRTVVSLLFS